MKKSREQRTKQFITNQIPSQSIQIIKEETFPTKTSSSQPNFNKDKIPVQKLHKESNNVNSIFDGDSVQIIKSVPHPNNKFVVLFLLNNQKKQITELDRQAEHAYQSKDASTRDLYCWHTRRLRRWIFEHYNYSFS